MFDLGISVFLGFQQNNT